MSKPFHLVERVFSEGVGISKPNVKLVGGSFRTHLVKKVHHFLSLQGCPFLDRWTTSYCSVLFLDLWSTSLGDERCQLTEWVIYGECVCGVWVCAWVGVSYEECVVRYTSVLVEESGPCPGTVWVRSHGRHPRFQDLQDSASWSLFLALG